MAHQIKNLLSSLMAQPTADATKPTWHLTLISEWPQVVGALKEHTRVEKIEGAVLTIGVFHASWMQELYLLSPMLIKTINDYLKHPYVRQIKCKAAARSKVVIKTKEPLPAQPIERSTRPLTPSEKQTLEKVDDPELRSMLETLLYVTHGNRLCAKKK